MNARILWIACLVTLAAVSPRSSTPSVAPRPTVPADVPSTGTNLLARGEKPPVMPASALQHTDAGAMAFAKFYLQTVDWGYATTNAAYMRHYYDKQCVRCQILDDAITSVQRAKQRFIGGRSHIIRVNTFAAKTNGSDLIVDTISDIDSYTAVDGHGNIHSADIAHKGFPEKIGVKWNGSECGPDTIAWNFGDGTSDTSTGPGKAYGHPDTCSTATCDDFFGHIYADRVGPTTITATPTWTAAYSIAGKPWAPITPGIPGATVQAQLMIKQAHSVLVPTPGHS